MSSSLSLEKKDDWSWLSSGGFLLLFSQIRNFSEAAHFGFDVPHVDGNEGGES